MKTTTTEAKGFRIIELSISNLKRIEALEIAPNGEPVVLTGDNGQGKSSVLDAILLAVTNSGLAEPIRRGSAKAVVKVKLGGDGAVYDLERVVTDKGNYLRILSEDGKQVPSPQKFMDALVGNLAFDPLAFAGMKPKEQAETLRAALGLDFSALDLARKEAFEERTATNRLIKSVESQMAAIPVAALGTPDEPVNVADLIARRDSMVQSQLTVTTKQREVLDLEKAKETASAEVARLESALAAARETLTSLEMDMGEAELELADLKRAMATPEALAAVQHELDTIEQTNEAVRKKQQRARLQAELKARTTEAEALSNRIDDIDAEKAKMLAEAPFPVPGLVFSEDGSVHFGGTPFSQMSTGEQIRISSLVAMAQNPSLRVIIIREGALINRANFQVIADLAAENEYQLWVEKFQEEPSASGLHITDGHISHVNGKPVAA